MPQFIQYYSGYEISKLLFDLERAAKKDHPILVVENFHALQLEYPLIVSLIFDWFESLIVIDRKIIKTERPVYFVTTGKLVGLFIQVNVSSKVFVFLKFCMSSFKCVSFYTQSQDVSCYYDFSRWRIKEKPRLAFMEIDNANHLTLRQKLKLLLKVLINDVLS